MPWAVNYRYDLIDHTFTYDANGSLTHECCQKQAEVVYQYDTENRLTAVYDQQTKQMERRDKFTLMNHNQIRKVVMINNV